MFLLYGQRLATHSVDPSLTHFIGEFPGLGMALVPDVVVPEALILQNDNPAVVYKLTSTRYPEVDCAVVLAQTKPTGSWYMHTVFSNP